MNRLRERIRTWRLHWIRWASDQAGPRAPIRVLPLRAYAVGPRVQPIPNRQALINVNGVRSVLAPCQSSSRGLSAFQSAPRSGMQANYKLESTSRNGPYPVLDNDGPKCADLRSKVPTCQHLVKSCYNLGSRFVWYVYSSFAEFTLCWCTYQCLECSVPAGIYCSGPLR